MLELLLVLSSPKLQIEVKIIWINNKIVAFLIIVIRKLEHNLILFSFCSL